MRLKTYYKTKKPTQTKKKQTSKDKKLEKEKQKLFKLSNNYADDSEYTNTNVDIDLTRLRYGMISSCELTQVSLEDGVIQLEKSWIQFIILMIHTIMENNPDRFMDILGENEITNMDLSVDTTYGKVTFVGKKYSVYTIYDTGYYIEIRETADVIFKAIAKLVKCLEIPYNSIKFHLKNKKDNGEVLNFNELKQAEYIVTIENVQENLRHGIHLVEIEFFGKKAPVHRLDVALLVFCNIIYDEVGYVIIKDLLVDDEEYKQIDTKLVSLENKVDKNEIYTEQLKDTDILIMTNREPNSILEFMTTTLFKLHINSEELLFKFRALELHQAKEWEVE